MKTIFSIQQCSYANIPNMVRIEKKKENKGRKSLPSRQWVKKEFTMENYFSLVSVAKDFKLNEQVSATGQAAPMKNTNPVLVLSSEKGKLAGKSGWWTPASSGSLVHFCNEPLHKGFICCFSTWMCLCPINEFPLPFRGNAPDMLKTQCSSQKISFPSNCPLSLYLLRQRNKENMKNCAAVFHCQKSFSVPFPSAHICLTNKRLQRANVLSGVAIISQPHTKALQIPQGVLFFYFV